MPSLFLFARDTVKFYGERLVLAGVSFEAHPGQRLGFVGENGAGKSTPLSWDADRHAELVFAGLGLQGLARERSLASLSGGERVRLALAALLMRRPRALLLDEPTNHVSLALAEELEEPLGSTPGAVVVATHERWLSRRWEGLELRLVAGRKASTEEAGRRRKDVAGAHQP